MEYSDEANFKRLIIAHFEKGEDLLESIKEVIEKEGIKNGIIISGYGTLDRCRWHYIKTTDLPPNNVFEVVEEPLELTSMDGVIADGEPHIHFEVSNCNKKTFGGHLEPGCRVLYLADVIIGEVEGVEMYFKKDSGTGLTGLSLEASQSEPGPKVEVDKDGNYEVSGRTNGWES